MSLSSITTILDDLSDEKTRREQSDQEEITNREQMDQQIQGKVEL